MAACAGADVAGAAAAALAATALTFRGDPLTDRAQTHAQQLYQCVLLISITYLVALVLQPAHCAVWCMWQLQ